MASRFILVLSLLAAPGVSFAGNMHDGKDHGMRLIKELNLTSEQTAKVKEIKSKFETSMKEGRQAVKAARQDLRASLGIAKRGAQYKAELLEKFKKVQALGQAQHQRRFEMALEIREILTDDQLTKFKAMHERRFQGKHEMDDGDED
jgi:periplasmic protein CpxP/Spy